MSVYLYAMFTKYIANAEHYKEVIDRAKSVKKHLWIGTADIKDLYIKKGLQTAPFLSELNDLCTKRVEIRLLHAKEPGENFRTDYQKYRVLHKSMEMVKCPRVHFKLFIFDLETAYIGSANLTGAGLGMKSENKRNFESGILTNDPDLVNQAIDQFDSVWNGSFCKNCQRKMYCESPIA